MITEKNTIRKKILIAEDDATLLEALVEKFMSQDVTVVKALDGQEALAYIINERPDLLLLDILMPKMDGLEVMKAVRKYDWGKNLPIILLTNVDADQAIAKQITDEPPAYYFVKADSDIDDVVTKTMELLGPKKEELD